MMLQLQLIVSTVVVYLLQLVLQVQQLIVPHLLILLQDITFKEQVQHLMLHKIQMERIQFQLVVLLDKTMLTVQHLQFLVITSVSYTHLRAHET